VDSLVQPLALTLMALCPQNVSRLRIGRISPASIATLRLLRDFLGCTFKLSPGDGSSAASAGSSSEGGASAGKKRAREGSEQGRKMGGGDATVIASCLGVGYKNTAKRVT